MSRIDAAAIIKIGRHFAKVRTLLTELGFADRARYIEHATMETQKVLPLEDVDPDKVPYFSTVLVHERGAAWK